VRRASWASASQESHCAIVGNHLPTRCRGSMQRSSTSTGGWRSLCSHTARTLPYTADSNTTVGTIHCALAGGIG